MRIPYGFIRDKVRMSWRDVLFGLDQQLLDPRGAIELATELLGADGHPVPTLIDLANVKREEEARAHVERLATCESEVAGEETRGKWLYIVLAWILENQRDYADPLRTVEEVYADFDYPESIVGFVRYMPSDEPDLGSRELHEARLYGKWKAYVEECTRKYACQPGQQ